MGRRLRLWQPHLVYSTVERTNDRQFSFKPNHLPDNPLLRWDSDPRSLDPHNRLIPKPSIINIIGSSLVRAQRNNPVELLWVEANINHIHSGFRVNHSDDLKLLSSFKQQVNSLIARLTNHALQRDGHLFSGPFRSEPCLDDPSAEQQFLYAATNVVKDGLVDKVSQSPFFSTYKHFAFGKPLRFWWIEWAQYELAGGLRNHRIHPKDYLEWGELKLGRLPEWEELTIHQQQTRYRQQIREIEENTRERLLEERRTVVGIPGLYALEPRERPESSGSRSRQPLCHAASRETRKAYQELWREFVKEYRKASSDYRNGYYEREFPLGSFRPPITTIYNASSL